MQVQALPIHFEKLGPNLLDIDLVIEEDLHLFVEIFDALRHDELIGEGLDRQPILHLHQLLQLSRQLALLVVEGVQMVAFVASDAFRGYGKGLTGQVSIAHVLINAPRFPFRIEPQVETSIAEADIDIGVTASVYILHSSGIQKRNTFFYNY